MSTGDVTIVVATRVGAKQRGFQTAEYEMATFEPHSPIQNIHDWIERRGVSNYVGITSGQVVNDEKGQMTGMVLKHPIKFVMM